VRIAARGGPHAGAQRHATRPSTCLLHSIVAATPRCGARRRASRLTALKAAEFCGKFAIAQIRRRRMTTTLATRRDGVHASDPASHTTLKSESHQRVEMRNRTPSRCHLALARAPRRSCRNAIKKSHSLKKFVIRRDATTDFC
jgi:hypothetical protein